MLKRIRGVKPLAGYRVELIYEGEEPFILDFTSIIQQGGVFAPMADADFFSRASVCPRGRSICWPGEIDFCADALWLQAHPEEAITSESSASAKA